VLHRFLIGATGAIAQGGPSRVATAMHVLCGRWVLGRLEDVPSGVLGRSPRQLALSATVIEHRLTVVLTPGQPGPCATVSRT
jgi:hypothetical protein